MILDWRKHQHLDSDLDPKEVLDPGGAEADQDFVRRVSQVT